mmetsp:Transcript_8702/g.9569  ORF Transcript_8702/g.9569 Transcript_8702/m.9569 type:complete len:204 (-) Transcript_8702:140-751(-)
MLSEHLIRIILVILPALSVLGTKAEESLNHKNLSSWHDCSEEVGIDNPVLIFTDVYSDPPVVTKDSGQTVYKTITYNPSEDDGEKVLHEIKADFTQYYRLMDKFWMPFLYAPNLNMCKEHDNLCPLKPNDPTKVATDHPPLNKLTPYGLYRSKQVFKDALTGNKIGCVDMQFLYCETEQDENSDKCSSLLFEAGEEISNLRTG